MKLRWREDGRGVFILQSLAGETVDGKEIWTDVPKALKPEKPAPVKPSVEVELAKALYDLDYKRTGGNETFGYQKDWLPYAKAALSWLRGRMPKTKRPHPTSADEAAINVGYYTALSEVEKALFGDEA